jgi:hypothetical protein
LRLGRLQLELALQLGDAIANAAAIHLDLVVTLAAAAAAAAALPVAARVLLLAQARRFVLQARDLDLQLRLFGARVPMKNLDDHAGAIEHLDAARALEVAQL